jgi:hypothetical protein
MQKKSTSGSLLVFGVTVFCFVISAEMLVAQTPVPSPSPTAIASPATSPTPVPEPKVVAVEGNLQLDDLIKVQLEGLDEWAEQNDPTKLVPFINGLAIRGNYPQEIHASKNHLRFHLEITPDNKEMWIDLLGEPRAARRSVAFSVGFEDKSPFDSVIDQTHPVLLTVISPAYGLIAFVVVFLTFILLIWLARKTNLIRDGSECPVKGKLRPYNLGRTQMAFWFFLIYASYMTIWLITGALDTITASLLALMGISAGTALSEAMIDSGKLSANSVQLQSLSAEKQSVEQTIPELQTQIDALNAKPNLSPEDTSNRDSLNKQVQDRRARLALINPQLDQLTASADAAVSKGFIRDILRDASGYSFHRFQIFAWTIVLGIIFVSSVYNNLTMPEFSATLLGLMGLSSGTYIGFKFPEKIP